MELTHSTRLSRAINRIRCVFDSGSPLQSWLKQSMSLPRKEPAPTPAGNCLISTFSVIIFSFSLRHTDTQTQRHEEGWRDGESAGMERHKGETAHLCILQSLSLSVPPSLYLCVCGASAPYVSPSMNWRAHISKLTSDQSRWE